MNNIQFKPWIGPQYATQGIEGLRILILGESHYGDEGEEYEDCTSDVVKEWAIEKRLAFFTKIAKSVLRLPAEEYITDEQKAIFWNSVAFYNYIQKFVGDEPRQRPSYDMWDPSKNAFIQTIKQIKPQLCVVFGYELWGNLPTPTQKLTADGFTTYVYNYGNPMFTGCVAHPAGGLSYSEAHARITALIIMAKSGQQ